MRSISFIWFLKPSESLLLVLLRYNELVKKLPHVCIMWNKLKMSMPLVFFSSFSRPFYLVKNGFVSVPIGFQMVQVKVLKHANYEIALDVSKYTKLT